MSFTEVKSPATCQGASDNGIHPEMESPSENRARVLSQDFQGQAPYSLLVQCGSPMYTADEARDMIPKRLYT